MRKTLASVDYVLNRIMILLFILLFGISGYVIWSNAQIFQKASNVLSNLQEMKPIVDETSGMANFDELKEINPDIHAWLTVFGTKIDHPVVQGKDNLHYMNSDIYGDYSLAGSIFLDTRNSTDYSDTLSIIYGHHMDKHQMFGDLDLFEDRDFMYDNHVATIITPDGETEYTVLAFMRLQEGDGDFDPSKYEDNMHDLLVLIKDKALVTYDPEIKNVEEEEDAYNAVFLVTCASGYTGERTVLVLVTRKKNPDSTPTTTPEGTGTFVPATPIVTETTEPTQVPPTSTTPPTTTPEPPQTGEGLFSSPFFWIAMLVISAVGITVTIRKEKKKLLERVS